MTQDLRAALLAFRDALLQLSLSLKDQQFEHAQQQQATEQALCQVLEKIKSQ